MNAYFNFQEKHPRQCLKEMVHGYNVSCALYVAVKLRLADYLKKSPMAIGKLAFKTATHPKSLQRLLRILVNTEIISFGNDVYSLTERGHYLCSDHPESIANETLQFAGGETYLAWSELLHSTKTGKPAFEKYFSKPLFSYFNDEKEAANRFHNGWHEISTRVGAELAEFYDFSECEYLIDVGGGYGIVAAPSFRKYEHLNGMIYDLKTSLVGTKKTLKSFNVANKVDVVEGDAFDYVPKGGDVHILKSVIHVCNSKQSKAILDNCFQSLPSGGRILVIERVLPQSPEYSWSSVVDCAMLVMTGGRERTLQDYQSLYRQSGFRLNQVLDLPSGFSILEGIKI